MSANRTECSRLEQRSVIHFLMVEKCKLCDVYRRMCDMFEEECFCERY